MHQNLPLFGAVFNLICTEDTEHVPRVGTSSALDSEKTAAVQASYFVFVFCWRGCFNLCCPLHLTWALFKWKSEHCTLWSHGKGNHSPAAVPASTPGTFCDPLSINCSCEGNMFLRWIWLKKQAAIPYCVSRSCHLFLLRKRETVWLATRNTDHCFNRGSLLLQACSQLLRCTCLLTLTTCFTAAVRLAATPGAALGGASASVPCRRTDLP